MFKSVGYRSLFTSRRLFSSTSFPRNEKFYEEFGNLLKEDLKKSMREKNVVKKETVKLLRSELKNYEINTKGLKKNEAGLLKVLNKMIKTRKNSISQYSAAQREDLAEKEAKQVKVLQEYLLRIPEQTK